MNQRPGHDGPGLFEQGRRHRGRRRPGWRAAGLSSIPPLHPPRKRQRLRGFGIGDACRRYVANGETKLIGLRQTGAAIERPGRNNRCPVRVGAGLRRGVAGELIGRRAGFKSRPEATSAAARLRRCGAASGVSHSGAASGGQGRASNGARALRMSRATARWAGLSTLA
jgi:hypothetical protein